MKDPVKIDLNDYVHSGEGANGESFFHKSDKNVMLKLYFASAPRDIITNELELSKKVYDLGIPTPEPGEYVTDGNGRYGIRFQRMQGKVSICRAVGDNPEKVEEYARRFAHMCLLLHSMHPEKGAFGDIKQVDREILANLDCYTPDERAYMEKVINDAPEGDCAIHGDLQFGNVIMVGDKDFFIDLGDFACGSPLFDLGMVLFTCKYDNPVFLREVYHMEPETASEFWHYFVKEYYGEEADEKLIEEMLRPYAGLKLLIMERNCGSLPDYHWLLKENS